MSEQESTKEIQSLYSDDEFKKFELKRLEYYNALIGSYNDKLEYKITPEIVKELVKVEKVIREIRDNRYYAISLNTDGTEFNLKFSVVVLTSDDETTKTGTLYLLEDVTNFNNGANSIYSTPIASYKDDNDAYFSVKLKKVFNMFEEQEKAGAGKLDPNIAPNLLALKSKKIAASKRLKASDEQVNEDYVISMIKELKSMGEYGDWVLNQFIKMKKNMGDKFPQKGDKNYFTISARILDQALRNAKTYPLTKEQIQKINAIQERRIQALDDRINYVAPVVKPTKAPTKQNDDSGSEKKSGGKAKKDDKGKSAKKEEKKSEKKEAKKKKQYYSIYPEIKIQGQSENNKPEKNTQIKRETNPKINNLNNIKQQFMKDEAQDILKSLGQQIMKDEAGDFLGGLGQQIMKNEAGDILGGIGQQQTGELTQNEFDKNKMDGREL